MNSNGKKPPTAPPAYRPQPTPRVLQRKTAVSPAPAAPSRGANAREIFNSKPGGHKIIQPRLANQHFVAPVLRGVNRPVIQRSQDRRLEQEKAKMQARLQKVTNMQEYADEHGGTTPQPLWPESQMVSGLTFGNNRSSASIITSRNSDTVFVAEQTGKAHKHPDDVWNLSGAETIACDEFRDRGLHAEMQIVYQLLMEWKADIPGWTALKLGTAEAFLKYRIGGGKSVSKGKGACRRCAAILFKLGVNVEYVQPSKYESMWVDPFEEAGLKNPWW